jgi:DNA invertase Pin-like site-specific DNA recombinase
MAMGIKLRVASMPSLRPEEPDGFFMFLIQMGMAQREVDVMRQRTRDGTEAKLRAGGWAHRASAGYVNKERHLKSGKYERWVEKDPEYNRVLREAWDLLLTDQWTLDQICEGLNRRGYARLSHKPWAWSTPKTGCRRTAKSNLQTMLHNPFYACWVVSEGV